MKLVENQVLWFVGTGNYARTRGFVKVESVGRKWAEISGVKRCRISVDTLVADAAGFSSPGRCYLSQEDWLAEEGPKVAWQSLRSQMTIACPAGVTLEDILTASKLLGMEVVNLSELKSTSN